MPEDYPEESPADDVLTDEEWEIIDDMFGDEEIDESLIPPEE